ncbi:LOW QUALITY PROTEIN: calcium homeostasis modulator protein 6-like [Sarcophilus harrisii]
MEKISSLLDLCIKHHRVLGMGFLSFLTAGGESLFSNVVFQCPCSATWNLSHPLVFFLVPALILFPPGYFLSFQAGWVMTGCCAQDQGDALGNISYQTNTTNIFFWGGEDISFLSLLFSFSLSSLFLNCNPVVSCSFPKVAGWIVIAFIQALFMAAKSYTFYTSPVFQFKFLKIYEKKWKKR